MKRMLEICCGDIRSVFSAVEGGADRIELCSATEVGGVTPSPGFFTEALAAGLPVNVLIRPRSGDFSYSMEEIALMCRDIKFFSKNGANGVVVGALTPEGDVDLDAMRMMIDCAGNTDVTFHRAFDLCRNPEKALEDIIRLGCTTLLTSGQASSAEKGIDLIRRLHEIAAGRIKIMAGAGVNPSNAASILSIADADALHASASIEIGSDMLFVRRGVNMGHEGDEYRRKTTSAAIVSELRKATDAASM